MTAVAVGKVLAAARMSSGEGLGRFVAVMPWKALGISRGGSGGESVPFHIAAHCCLVESLVWIMSVT